MNMVTESNRLDYGDKLVEFYNNLDWGWLFDFVREKYGIGMVRHPEVKMDRSGRIEVSWPENLKDKCGLFGKHIVKYICRLSRLSISMMSHTTRTFWTSIEAAGLLQKRYFLCRLERVFLRRIPSD